MQVATLVIVFPIDARKISRLIGFLNPFAKRKVARMNTQLIIEITDIIRSTTEIALSKPSGTSAAFTDDILTMASNSSLRRRIAVVDRCEDRERKRDDGS